MNKNELTEKLVFNHEKFLSYLLTLDDKDFVFSLKGEKWSPGQQADHILRSLSPLVALLRLPRWWAKLFFKKANRPSKTYEKLIEKYHQRLAGGGRASGRFVPQIISASGKMDLTGKIRHKVSGLCKAVDKYSEDDLDKIVLPHPLLGWITLREMLYFTIYHVDHHHRITMRDLALK